MKIDIDLSADSFLSAAKQLRDYADSLQEKSERLVKDLGDAGVEYANMYLEHDDTGATRSSIQFTQNVNIGVISVGGAAVWIEFGTGVLANAGNAPHPKKDEVGAVGWGEYGHGLGNDVWWFINKEGKKCYTAGIHMNPFMYESAQSLRFILLDMAKEVFKSD